MEQEDKLNKLAQPTYQKTFTGVRAMGQYIGVNTRPVFCRPVQLLAPDATKSAKEEHKSLQNFISNLRSKAIEALKFVRLDLERLKLILFTDASFANTHDLESHMGYVILLADDTGRTNISQYGSKGCRHRTRSVMGSEIHAAVLGFDFAHTVEHMLDEVTSRSAPIEVYCD